MIDGVDINPQNRSREGVIAKNGSDFSALSIDPWIELDGMDFAFSMDFSPDGAGAVPEPSGMGWIGALALLALAGTRRLGSGSR